MIVLVLVLVIEAVIGEAEAVPNPTAPSGLRRRVIVLAIVLVLESPWLVARLSPVLS